MAELLGLLSMAPVPGLWGRFTKVGYRESSAVASAPVQLPVQAFLVVILLVGSLPGAIRRTGLSQKRLIV